MDVEISQSDLTGTARAPPSKSYTHRAILAAGCSGGALVFDPLISADTKATMRAVEAFGGDVTDTGEAIEIDGFGGEPGTPADVLDCGNSGTTTRLVSGTAALVDGITVLTGDASLRSRPQGPMLSAIEQLDGRAESSRDNGKAPLVIKGPVSGGTVSIPGDVSSQYVSSLLMAGALTEDGVEIELETELKSAPYVDITLELLSDFGVTAKEQADGYSVAGGQFYEPSDGEYHVPGDFSSISYLLAAGAIAAEDGESVQIEGAYPSAQGDTYIVDVLKDMGGDVDWNRNDGVLTVKQSSLSGTTVDVGDTPDLLPTIAALGAAADGETRIENCEHVRYKETDRVTVMAKELSNLGAKVEEEDDALTVYGGESDLVGSIVDGHADHRIVMALAVAGLAADGTTMIADAEHVDVSFPDFFEVLYDLGGDVQR